MKNTVKNWIYKIVNQFHFDQQSIETSTYNSNLNVNSSSQIIDSNESNDSDNYETQLNSNNETINLEDRF